MEELTIPVYLIMGFLEAGKSSFLEEVFGSGEFADGEKGVYICTEEGEVEIDPHVREQCNISTITLDEEEQLTTEFFAKVEKKYHPQFIFIEYNGMWDPDTLLQCDLPEGWGIYQIITIIDASTFAVYLNNMKSIIGNILKCSEMVIFNRCDDTTQDLASFRRQVKAVNNRLQIMFEHKDGHMIELGKDIPPYDLDAPIIEITDEDYGLFYMDAAEDQERYDGKTVHFRGKVMKNRKFSPGYFVPGRNAMTCCEADIRFIGFLCKSTHVDQLRNGQWIDLTAKIKYEKRKEYYGVGPVLYTTHIKSADPPKEDLVYFN